MIHYVQHEMAAFQKAHNCNMHLFPISNILQEPHLITPRPPGKRTNPQSESESEM